MGGNGYGDGDQFVGFGIQGVFGVGFFQCVIGGEYFWVLFVQGIEGFFYGGDEFGLVVQYGDIFCCFCVGSGVLGYQF